MSRRLSLFSTCPASTSGEGRAYLEKVSAVARWSERFGYEGILVYSDNSLVDPWLLAHVIVQETRSLRPLVAVQPVYTHPYWLAKQVASIGHLYGRAVALNMVAGGFKNDLLALGDTTPHDRRYDRLVEYSRVVLALLEGGSPVSVAGSFYSVEKLRLSPPLAPHLRPRVLVSGSSDAGLAAARALGATAVEYPKPAGDYQGRPQEAADDLPRGVRLGIICRDDEAEAWRIAHERFPVDRRGELTHQVAMKVSDSVWHQQLSALGTSAPTRNHPYWLVPFENYKTMCPYLVGAYDLVAEELAGYLRAGFQTFILDIPPSEEECEHISRVFDQATQRVDR
jgi:alkanesulfonate monooxygenase